MTENFEIKDLNYYIDWLNRSINEEHIKYYEYSNFTNIQQIGRGSYGNVVRANWKNSDRLFALKSFNNDKQTLKEIVKEVGLIYYVYYRACARNFYILVNYADREILRF